MTDSISADEITHLLSQRFEILQKLKGEPMTQTELSKCVELSLPSVHRTIKRFAELELVESADGTYSLTPLGRELLQEHQQYRNHISHLYDRKEFCSGISDAISIDDPIFDDAEIIFGQPSTVDSASYRNKEIVENSTRLRAVLDSISSSYLEGHRTQLKHGESSVIVSTELAEALVTTYQDRTAMLLQNEDFELYRTDESIPFTITMAECDEESYAILLKHERNQATVSVRSTSPEAISWAEAKIQKYLTNAERVTLTDIEP